MPRQRKPNINPKLLNEALGDTSSNELLKSLIQKSRSQKAKGKKRPPTPTEEVVAKGDVTKRPMLPEEDPNRNSSEVNNSSFLDPLSQAQTPKKARELIKSMAQRTIHPFRSRGVLNNDDQLKIYFQSHQIPKNPKGFSEEVLDSWEDEQSNPTPIEAIPNRIPEKHHHLFEQFEHDPTEECHANGRNPIGHPVTIWNHDGAIPGFPRGFNIGLVVGVAPRNISEGRKELSPEIISQHHEICGGGTSHKKGCPVKFHDDNCRGGEHAKGCTIPENTIVGASHEGETLYKVLPWSSVSTDEIQKRHRSRIDFDAVGSPEPELKATGIRGLQGGTVVPASRVIHLPTDAVQDFLFNRTTQSKRKANEFFTGQFSEEGVAGSIPILVKQHKFFENPLGYRRYSENKSLPAYASIMDQLENPSKIGEEGLRSAPAGFVRGFTPEKPESPEESIVKNILNKKEPKTSKKLSYTHVNESYEPSPSCRFCEDASHKDGKSEIVQTSVSPDGRPLYAHEECDNPFAFAEKFNFEFGGPNVVDTDFISMASHNWGMGSQPGARRVNRELGITTPSRPSNLVDPGVPGNTKRIDSMGLPEHKAAEQQGDPDELAATETEVNNLNSNGTAKPPK